jgi:hypothetical protein
MNSLFATFVSPENFDLRRGFTFLAVFALVLFLCFFDRLTKRFRNRQSTADKIVSILSSPIPSPSGWQPLRYAGLVMLGLVAGWGLTSASNSHRLSKVIAMQRTLLVHRLYTNPLPSVASVVVEQATNGLDVKIELEMTDPYSTGYRTIDIGHCASREEVIRKWGFMDWREDGLHVGRGSNEFFVPQMELESGGR